MGVALGHHCWCVEGVLGSGVAVVVVISEEITVLLAVGGVVGS